LDEIYTSGEQDADEAMLGPIYNDDGITAALWAPTAQNVALKVYGSDKRLLNTHAMTRDDTTGIWSYTGLDELDRQLYQYEVTVYSPVNDALEVLDVTDPYSVNLTTNGRFSQFVNLLDDDLKPDGWDTHAIPTVENFEDIVIYEGHIREFSVRDASTSEAARGKYMAFAEPDSLPMQHLATLAEAGLTHFHVLPANDIATVNEDEARTIGWNSTIGEFCALIPAAEVCVDNTARDITIAEKYASFDTALEQGAAQAFTQQIRSVDQFNWGYDPKHFNVPDGSYASNPEGIARIIEKRAMIQGLHEAGLRVALDVVYNHTNASGLFQNSVFDKVVPGYYHRYTIENGDIVRQTCCEDTEPRNRMMEKLMEDSLLIWAQHYKYDSFRFDIMSQASKQTMLDLFESVKAIDPDTYFYGEGWGKDTSAYGGFEIADQRNMAGSEIGTFNDVLREAIRFDNTDTNNDVDVMDKVQSHIFSKTPNEEAERTQDIIKVSLAGNIEDFVFETRSDVASEASNFGAYAKDPADTINYLSKHDGNTLWDRLQYLLPADLSIEERVRAQNITVGIPLMSQGIPFLQIGGDFLRSKSMDRNTYDAGDWFTYVDFTMQDNNWNKGLPPAEDNEFRWDTIGQFVNDTRRQASGQDIQYASEVFQELLSIRTSSPLFRLTSAEDIKQRVGFHNIGSTQQHGLIAMSIDDGINEGDDAALVDIDSANDAIMVVINSGYTEKSIEVPTAAGFALHETLASSVDSVVRGASFADTSADGEVKGTFTVPALSIAVFVKPQGMTQGYGLSALATAGAPDIAPYGSNTIYVRGGMNGWNATDPMSYEGSGVYEVVFELSAGEEVQFKVADGNYDIVNYGSNDGALVEGEATTLVYNAGNLAFTPDTDGYYAFTLNALDSDNPILTVANDATFDFPIYVRGGMNGWNATDELEYIGLDTYSVAFDLAAEEVQFKVADFNYDAINGGTVEGADPLTVGNNFALSQGGGNIVFTPPAASTYHFVVDAADTEALVLRVFETEFVNEAIFVRGSMNGWNATDPLIYNDDGSYSADITLADGDVNFKVANGDYTSVNLGAASEEDAQVSLGKAKQLTQDANSVNLMLKDVAAGTYEFTVSGPDWGKPRITVTPIE
ncbi:MAG: pullulanase-type alpha-1,6-glucosidase, partial [Glaciecola sp.]